MLVKASLDNRLERLVEQSRAALWIRNIYSGAVFSSFLAPFLNILTGVNKVSPDFQAGLGYAYRINGLFQ